MRPGSTRHGRGFTLIELGVVILIIGLLMSFLLAASFDGLRRAEERGTQALILKLDNAMADRVEALTQQRPLPNRAHRYLAMTEVPGPPPTFLESNDRARLIARIDYLKRELPDVFFVQDDPNYPLNFAGMPFHPETANPIGTSSENSGLSAAAQPYARYLLPLGFGVQSTNTLGVFNDLAPAATVQYGEDGRSTLLSSQGIFGASYSAMGALTRQLGYYKLGYNGIDDNGNGLIDELAEGRTDPGPDGVFGTSDDIDRLPEIQQRLAAHRHITARSEMLYAILVGGAGPLGSVFSPDDFTDREVQDTDGDGLLEFVDAWGRPLQFYRWPVYYATDTGSRESFQQGAGAYRDRVETRDQNTLDPNQLLVAPAWWADLSNLVDGPQQMSARANIFQQHFFSVIDPQAQTTAVAPPATNPHWDRNGFYKRRAYFFKFLIASSGPDRQLGFGSFGLDYTEGSQGDVANYRYDRSSAPVPRIPAADRDRFAARMVLIENQADRSDPYDRILPANEGGAGTLAIDAGGAGTRALYQLPPNTFDSPTTGLIRENWGLDDITNQTINSPGSGVR